MRLEIAPDVAAEMKRARSLADDGQLQEARETYSELLAALADRPDQAAAVAHMYAIIVDDLREKLAINEESLRLAESVPDDGFPVPLRATLLANIGHSHFELGDQTAARRWYLEAADAAVGLDDDEYGRMMRDAIARQLQALR